MTAHLNPNYINQNLPYKKTLTEPILNLKISENSLKVLEKRYLKKDLQGKPVEAPLDMFKRVAFFIASADLKYNPSADINKLTAEFLEVMANMEFLPNSPTLMNAGRELGQLSACFVLPVGDSMESIFDSIKYTALIHKTGGGTGFSFSKIRPKNDVVLSTKGVASGPISFMTVFDAATETIKQGGTRRGANMGILRVDHPDILEFISAKKDMKRLNNFNVSVAITEDFMKAVEENKDYDIINPRDGKKSGKLPAKLVFDEIVKNAWHSGEPGIIFLDRINRDNPTPKIGEIESTNPCGEQPLLPYESCNLGSINLGKIVKNKQIDYEKLGLIAEKGVHFLDNVIDMNNFPIPQIKEMTLANRKIGLGIMGFADMLLKLEIPYNSEEALKVAEEVMSFIDDRAFKKSEQLAVERGAFPNFENSIFFDQNLSPVRNATVTTIAPTGTISIIAGASSGIEPLFAISYVRKNVLDNDEMIEVHPYFEKIAKEEGFYSEELMKKIAKKGTLHGIKEIPEKWRKIFVTAHDITPECHIKMQSAFQKYVDNAVSKTVNFPNSATIEDITKVYKLAYKLGCKGVTVYRDGSRDTQVLNIGETEKKEAEQVGTPAKPIIKRSRPTKLTGTTVEMKTGCGPLYVTVNKDTNGFFELFNTMGKAGGCASSQCEAIGRLVSLAWRSGISSEAIIKQLAGISCHKPSGLGPNKILSCADAIAKAILAEMAYEETPISPDSLQLSKQEAKKLKDILKSSLKALTKGGQGACPECGGSVEFEEGCAKCYNCGFSDCG